MIIAFMKKGELNWSFICPSVRNDSIKWNHHLDRVPTSHSKRAVEKQVPDRLFLKTGSKHTIITSVYLCVNLVIT